MLRKDYLSHFLLSQDAAPDFLAPISPLDEADISPSVASPSLHPFTASMKPPSGLRRSPAARRLMIVLALLVAGTALLTLANIPALLGGLSVQILKPWAWAPLQILVATFILFILEAILIVAVMLQNRRHNQLETLLRESEERMSFAAECANLGFWRWEAEADRIWASPHCLRMFGQYSGKRLTMAKLVEMVHPDDRASVEKAINDALLNHTTYEVDYRLCLLDGVVRWVRTRGRGTLDSDGNLVTLSGTVIDVTESKQMQAVVEEQQRSLAHLARVGMVGELSGALAHELNQPLTAILSNAQAARRMIEHGPIDVTELRNVISDIIDDDARAGNVIRHLRALLKKDEARTELVDVNAIVSRTLELTRSALTAQRIVIVARFSSEALRVRGDAVQLQQLLLNLVLNASEAMAGVSRDSGALIVTTNSVNGELLQISICDTGPGIPEGIKNRLFDPFFSTKQSGLGLGLSICRAIAERHGGRIHAVNNPGHGATFHVSLPLAKEQVL
jgi:PAS domain S-box-containing protein